MDKSTIIAKLRQHEGSCARLALSICLCSAPTRLSKHSLTIRGIGNWLRHQYERIELPVIFKTVRDDLPPLKAAVVRALGPPPINPLGPSPG
jgi:hypothetical protein